MPEMQNVEDVIDNYDGLARKVLDYSMAMKEFVDAGKQPGFSEASIKPLEAYVAVEDFVRVGNFKEVMGWQDYAAFLIGWAPTADWECSFKRITQSGSTVFLELEERSRMGEFTSTVNSVSVYEFNGEGLLHHLDIYLQMPMPDPEMLASYKDVDITG